jgi:hypothetical protein
MNLEFVGVNIYPSAMSVSITIARKQRPVCILFTPGPTQHVRARALTFSSFMGS